MSAPARKVLSGAVITIALIVFSKASVSIVSLSNNRSSNEISLYQCVIRDETERNLTFRSIENTVISF